MSTTVKIKKLHEDAFIPAKAYVSGAGFDLHALEDVIIAPGETVKVRTGLAFEIPDGFEMQVRPRSGISTKTKLRVVLGTVDSQYRGEVGVIVDNIAVNTKMRGNVGIDTSYPLLHIDGSNSRLKTFNNDAIYQIRKGDRIAQAVIQKIPHVVLYEVDELSESRRGTNGFGSSGV